MLFYLHLSLLDFSNIGHKSGTLSCNSCLFGLTMDGKKEELDRQTKDNQKPAVRSSTMTELTLFVRPINKQSLGYGIVLPQTIF